MIVEKGAAFPGPYDLRMTPYMREPLDALGLPGVRRMNWVFPPQSGKTKASEVGLGYLLEHDPLNVLYIRPAEPDIDEAFRDRFRPMIEANLSHLIPAGESGSQWMVLSKNPRIELTRCILYAAAATVTRQLTSRSAARIFYDETDTGEVSSNTLGDVLKSAEDRQQAFDESRSILWARAR